MLTKADVRHIIGDIFRTEAARYNLDTLGVFDTQDDTRAWQQLPPELLAKIIRQAADFFTCSTQDFHSFDELADAAFTSFNDHKQVAFSTSGSTGVPKKCIHTLEMIAEESRAVASEFSRIRRIVSLVPSHHLYGFTFTVVLPHTLQVPVHTLPALPTQPWNESLQPGDLLVGFPLFWDQWLRLGNRFPKGIELLCSTAPCKDEIIDGLEAAGAAYFTEIYGASETGAIGRRHHAREPFELFSCWEINPSAKKIKRRCQTAWVDLPDETNILDGRFLVPLKRRDACVQVAGINVYPKHVEKILSQHPAVKTCRVRLMRPEEGTRLKAFVVLQDGYTPADALPQLRAYAHQHLTVHEQPRSFTFGPQVPRGALGKEADW